MAWIRGWSIAAKLFALQLVAIVLLAAIAVAWIWADARADVERDAAAKTLAVAQTHRGRPVRRRRRSRPTTRRPSCSRTRSR